MFPKTMSGTQILRIALAGVFLVNAALLLTILVVKPLNRLRTERRQARRRAYVGVLSRHLATRDEMSLGPRVAQDQAFLDALIDMRLVVSGREAEVLGSLVDQYDIARRQARILRRGIRPAKRLRAAVALAELANDSAAEVLMGHLSDREPEVRIQCARGLARMKWRPAINVVLARFDKETPWVRSRFADSLVAFGSAVTWPAIAHIAANHKSHSPGTSTVVRMLGNVKDPESAGPLLEILDEATDPEIQIAIVETLGRIGAPIAYDPVEKAARSEDWRVRAKAATALATLGDESVVPTLVLGLEDPSWWVRRNAAAALTRFPSGIEALYGAIRSPDPFARDAATEALADAGEVLAARDRIELGVAVGRDFELLEFVRASEKVTT